MYTLPMQSVPIYRHYCYDLNTTEDEMYSIELFPPPKMAWLVGWFMVFNATFNNISVISWRSVLLVEETRVPSENQRPVASH